MGFLYETVPSYLEPGEELSARATTKRMGTTRGAGRELVLAAFAKHLLERREVPAGSGNWLYRRA